ncbi:MULTISPECIES: ferredoxin--NADP reductase [unclassified Flavobacterium]|uniref:ferredoxin--NADP reductase n=1 Tax=unclassified Flavobacterium TaxID=196869 RepID=UPI00086EFC22|nr:MULTISPECIES: ferredoxin--NADP reductase [unclassified Flavobacterium]MBN9285339.1 ferredoxin--NADP reductase [Flavobacterium sp.]ODS79117.1 MAG: flavodoxin reductase [Chryseobacterium sp. SCN 40-13]OJV71623.1 MAG: flavodoxin reductase [Flavobacterium sp. 40-81]
MSTFHSLLIKEVRRETAQAVSVSFDVPENLKSEYQFIAGQYINIKYSQDGKEIRRAYSICSSPSSGELRVAIKAVSDGYFSRIANEKLKEGDRIEVGVPEGKFTFEPKPDNQRNYAAFAAGSGITPVMSIIQAVLEGEPNSTFVLVYGNKSPEDTIFYKKLHDLQLQYVGRFFVHYVFSQAKAEDSIFGRIERSTVNFVIKNKHASLTFAKYYLCGPEEMIATVSGVLKEQNVPEKDIKFELFTTSSTETKIENTLGGHTKITVLVDDEEVTFEMAQKQTILEAALKQGVDAPYSCQGGICSSCLAKITSGSAEMRKNSILTDKEIASGLILTCQAHPTSSEIYIDYDDV